MGHGRRLARRGAWRLDLLASLVDYNAMRPGIVQTFSALLGESVTDGHPAREFFTERYAQVRAEMAAVLRAEFGDRLPAGSPRSRRRRCWSAVWTACSTSGCWPRSRWTCPRPSVPS